MNTIIYLLIFGAFLRCEVNGVDQKPGPEFLNQPGKAAFATPPKRSVENYGKIPMHFEANEGQFDQQVNFMSRGQGYNLFLTPCEAVLALSKAPGKTRKEISRSVRLKRVEKMPKPESTVIRMTLKVRIPKREIPVSSS